MSKLWIVVSLVTVSVTAFAGKREREQMEQSTQPMIKEAEAKFHEACGCTLAIGVDAAIETMDEIRNVGYMARNVRDEAPKYCTDAASRKAMCQMKTLVLAKGRPAFTFKNGQGTALTDGQSYTSWDMMTRVLDK